MGKRLESNELIYFDIRYNLGYIYNISTIVDKGVNC